MTPTPRHLLMVATQCADMGHLDRLEEAAHALRRALLAPGAGACVPGLPDGTALVPGWRLTVTEINDAFRRAIRHAADQRATLVLAVLGHGYVSGSHLRFMGWDSPRDTPNDAVDVNHHLANAVTQPGIASVVSIIDTCAAAAATLSADFLTDGVNGGHVVLHSLMGATRTGEGQDLQLSTELARAIEHGLPSGEQHLTVPGLKGALQEDVVGQTLAAHTYDGSLYSTGTTWVARNVRWRWEDAPHGLDTVTEALRAAVGAVDPAARHLVDGTLSGLHRLELWASSGPGGLAHQRALGLIRDATTAHNTVRFLREHLGRYLGTANIRRALAFAGAGATTGPWTETAAIETLALTYPQVDGSCRRVMVRFAASLMAQAGQSLRDHRATEWARDFDLASINDAAAAAERHHREREPRLVVSLHSSLAGDWPEEIDAWLVTPGGGDPEHTRLHCRPPDRDGADDALRRAVAWASDRTDQVCRIDVAVPAKLMRDWRPEEVRYGPKLGVHRDVTTRWSGRVFPPAHLRWCLDNAVPRLAGISPDIKPAPVDWLTSEDTRDLPRLEDRLCDGRYPGVLGLVHHPGQNDDLLNLVLPHAPAVVWPADEDGYAGDHDTGARACVECCWPELPGRFLHEYRARWSGREARPIAGLRAVWDDEEWLDFCKTLLRPRSTT